MGAKTTTSQGLFDELADAYLQLPGVSYGRILHNQGLKVNGKIFAMVVRDQLVVKIPAARAAELVADGEASPFEPRPGRAMKEWVSLERPSRLAQRRRWAALIADAHAFVAGSSLSARS